MARVLIVLVFLATFTTPAESQQTAELRIQLIARQGERVSGALVSLIDETDRAVSETLSNSGGSVTLRAAPGRYRVRVRRIGYRPFFSDPVTLPQSSQLELRVESPPVRLSTMVVSARSQCVAIDRDAAALSAAWEEIAKALQARQLTVEDLTGIVSSSVFRREIDADGRVTSADTTHFPAPTGKPFAAIDPGSLVRDGYVRGDPRRGWDYYGPDEAVLLSRGFAETHCFRIVRNPRRKDDLGVAFEPVRGRRMTDIKGVVWLNAATSELREIEFRFVNVDLVERFGPGGFTRFRRLPSGSWIVSEWVLRMPQIAITTGRVHSSHLLGYIENGGEVTDGTGAARQ